MLVKCSWCQKTFNSDRYGRQHCPHCRAELDLPPPRAEEAMPQPVTLQPGTGPARQAPGTGAAEPGRAPTGETQVDPWAQPPGEGRGAGQQPGAFGPGGQQPGAFGPGGQQPGGFGPGGQQPGAFGPGGQQPGAFGPGGQQPGAFGPGGQQPGAFGPGGQQPGAFGPGGQQPGAFGPGGQPPGAFGPGGQQPGGFGPGGGGGYGPGGGGGGLPPGGGGWGGWPPGGGEPQDEDAPWERRSELGLMPALVETWKQSCLDPRNFFARLKTHDIGEAFLYGWIFYTLGMILAGLTSTLTPGAFDTSLIWGQIIGAPILAAIVLFFNAGIIHLGCMLLGCAGRGFDATFRAVAYSQGPAVFYVVPFLGTVVGAIWTLVLTVYGVAGMQRTTVGRAVAAVLLPSLLLAVCCGCAFGLFAFSAAAAFGGFGELP